MKFSVGDRPVEDLRMIERHYFEGECIKSYDFNIPFVMPNTENVWESTLEVPLIDDDLLARIVESPFKVESDSFYFVGEKLVMHNKARYRCVLSLSLCVAVWSHRASERARERERLRLYIYCRILSRAPSASCTTLSPSLTPPFPPPPPH